MFNLTSSLATLATIRQQLLGVQVSYVPTVSIQSTPRPLLVPHPSPCPPFPLLHPPLPICQSSELERSVLLTMLL